MTASLLLPALTRIVMGSFLNFGAKRQCTDHTCQQLWFRSAVRVVSVPPMDCPPMNTGSPPEFMGSRTSCIIQQVSLLPDRQTIGGCLFTTALCTTCLSAYPEAKPVLSSKVCESKTTAGPTTVYCIIYLYQHYRCRLLAESK